MINIDNKILARLIADRLQPLLPVIARPDQSGFVPGCSTSCNLRTLFAVLHSLKPDLPAAALLLDATKAFYSLEWPYLFALPRQIELSTQFLHWISLLYARPIASLRVNGLIS